jgi:hypothetical protein
MTFDFINIQLQQVSYIWTDLSNKLKINQKKWIGYEVTGLKIIQKLLLYIPV